MAKRLKQRFKNKRQTLSDKYKQYGLLEMMKKDANNQAIEEAKTAWYHGNMSREAAEAKLQKGIHADGYFLIRGSIYNNDIVLSFLNQKRCVHYKINVIKEGFYQISNGPILQGLVMLVDQYTKHSHSLPVKLGGFCKGEPPPTKLNKFGRTNLLHQAVNEGNVDIAKKILNHPMCPDVTAWDEKGSTVLHMASTLGLDELVEELLERDVDVDMRDSSGSTPLEKAVIGNKPETMMLLMVKGAADPHARNYLNEKMPLHQACKYGHAECVKVLLSMNAIPWPKDSEGLTPHTIALRYGHKQCAELIENHEPLPALTHRKEWLHSNLDRNGAIELLTKHKLRDGMFLVRKSSRNPDWFVLVLSWGQKPYHYQIRNMYNHNFYVENGPHFTSLEHLIEYYSGHDDNSIPCPLKISITPECQEKEMNIKRQLSSPKDENDGKKAIEGSASKGVFRKDSILVHDEAPPVYPREPVENKEISKLNAGSLQLGYEIGQGEFGSVFRGIWISPENKKVDVAIKTLHEDLVTLGRAQFEKEAYIMQNLNNHFIVKLIGVCEGPPIMLVQELMSMGSLLDYLLDYPEQIDPHTDLYLWAAQIASGMAYLEKRGFVHRDLAARNILLSSKSVIKISDFGLSRAVGSDNQQYTAKTGGKWPVKWYAPECVYYGRFSSASDVWSYGVTLWEMFSFGDLPYGEMTGSQVLEMIERGIRLPQPECSDSVYETMRGCWRFEPEDRCTFEDLIEHFSSEPEYYNILSASEFYPLNS